MPQPFLKLKNIKRFAGIVKLAGDGRSCTMAGDPASGILFRYARFKARQGNVLIVDVASVHAFPPVHKQKMHVFTGFGIFLK